MADGGGDRRPRREVVVPRMAGTLLAATVLGVPVALLMVVGSPIPPMPPEWSIVARTIEQRSVPAGLFVAGLSVVVWLTWLQVAWAAAWELLVAGPRVSDGVATRRAPLVAGPLADWVARIVSGAIAAGAVVGPPATAIPHPTPTVAAEAGHAAVGVEEPGAMIRPDARLRPLAAAGAVDRARSAPGFSPGWAEGRPPLAERSVDGTAASPLGPLGGSRDRPGQSIGAGVGALLAVALLEALRRHRCYRMSRRAPGSILADPPTELVEVERWLHAAADDDGAAWWRAACRSLAARPVWPDRSVPAPRALRLADGRLTLDLERADRSGPPPPWSTDDGGTSWFLPSTVPIDALPEPPADADPLPAMVMLGPDLALNLEAVGRLVVDGDQESVGRMLRALAHHLEFSPLGGDVELRATEAVAQRAGLGTRGRRHVDRLRAELTWRLDRWSAHLGGPSDDVYTFRLRHPSRRVRPTIVFITGDEEPAFEPVIDRAARRALPLAVVVAGPAVDERGWSISVGDGRATLEPLGVVFEPHLLDRSVAHEVGRLLDHGRERRGVPLVDGLAHSVLASGHRVPAAGRHLEPDPVRSGAAASEVLDVRPAPAGGREAARPMVRVLGPIEVEGLDVELTPQQLSLVACLACTGPVPRDALIEGLWDGRSISAGRFANLLAELRAKIGRHHLPEARNGRYSLSGMGVDLELFEQAAAIAASAPSDAGRPAIIEVLTPAVKLIRGVPLATPNGRYWAWVGHQSHLTARVESLVADTAARLAELYRLEGELAAALWACEQGLLANPLDETLIVTLTEVYLGLGRSGAARRLVQTWEARVRNLGCGEPSDGPRHRLTAGSAAAGDRSGLRP